MFSLCARLCESLCWPELALPALLIQSLGSWCYLPVRQRVHFYSAAYCANCSLFSLCFFIFFSILWAALSELNADALDTMDWMYCYRLQSKCKPYSCNKTYQSMYKYVRFFFFLISLIAPEYSDFRETLWLTILCVNVFQPLKVWGCMQMQDWSQGLLCTLKMWFALRLLHRRRASKKVNFITLLD